MDCFYTTTNNEDINYITSLEEHSTNLDLLCDISKFCCLDNINDYKEFFESKIEKNIDNNNTKTTKTK